MQACRGAGLAGLGIEDFFGAAGLYAINVHHSHSDFAWARLKVTAPVGAAETPARMLKKTSKTLE